MSGGFFDWGRQLLATDGRVYFAGRTYDNWLEGIAGLIQVQEGTGLVVVPTEAGIDIIQQYYRGPTEPADPSKYVFTTGLLADSEDDYFHFRRIKGANGAAQFFAGIPPQSDRFSAVDGSSYRLSRLPALGVVPGVEVDDFPINIYLDGTLTPSAAVIDGRDVEATQSGVLEIVYTPVFDVVISSLSQSVEDSNKLLVSVTLSEVRTS